MRLVGRSARTLQGIHYIAFCLWSVIALILAGMKPNVGRNKGLAVALLLLLTIALVVGCSSAASVPGGVRVPMFRSALARWSPDSRTVAVPSRHGIELRGLHDGVGRVLKSTPLLSVSGRSGEGRLEWSTNGRRLYFIAVKGPKKPSGFWADSVKVDGTDLEQTPLRVPVAGASWSPGGWPLVFVPNALAHSNHGRLGPRSNLWQLNGPRSRPERLVYQRGEDSEPLISPDGQKVIYCRSYEGHSSVWIMALGGGTPRLLANHFAAIFGMSWSPNNHEVALAAVTAQGDHRTHLYVASTSGRRLLRLGKDEILGSPPAWMPNGEWLTYSNYQGQIIRIRVDDGERRVVAQLNGQEIRDLAWSPDGMRLAYSSRSFPPND